MLNKHSITRITAQGVPLQVVSIGEWQPAAIAVGLGASASHVFVVCGDGPADLNNYGEPDESVHVMRLDREGKGGHPCARIKRWDSGAPPRDYQWEVEGGNQYGFLGNGDPGGERLWGPFETEWTQRTIEAAHEAGAASVKIRKRSADPFDLHLRQGAPVGGGEISSCHEGWRVAVRRVARDEGGGGKKKPAKKLAAKKKK